MTEIRDRTFSAGETVDTDGNTFIGCKFESASLRYAGGEHPVFEECTFGQMNWYFADSALRTIQLLQSLNNNGAGDRMVAELFKPGNYIGE
jgi:hypothetical protein